MLGTQQYLVLIDRVVIRSSYVQFHESQIAPDGEGAPDIPADLSKLDADDIDNFFNVVRPDSEEQHVEPERDVADDVVNKVHDVVQPLVQLQHAVRVEVAV